VSPLSTWKLVLRHHHFFPHLFLSLLSTSTSDPRDCAANDSAKVLKPPEHRLIVTQYSDGRVLGQCRRNEQRYLIFDGRHYPFAQGMLRSKNSNESLSRCYFLFLFAQLLCTAPNLIPVVPRRRLAVNQWCTFNDHTTVSIQLKLYHTNRALQLPRSLQLFERQSGSALREQVVAVIRLRGSRGA
jgi:hypothetical protein